MSAPADRWSDDLPPDTPGADGEVLSKVARVLEDSRPVPRPEFRGEVRRRLTQSSRPLSLTGLRLPRWQPQAALYAVFGVALLSVAAIGAAGVGPFAV